MQLICNRTQNDAIWGLIALFLTNQIAGNTIDFKMNVIKGVKGPSVIGVLPSFDLVRDVAVDFMHCVCLGVTRQFVSL